MTGALQEYIRGVYATKIEFPWITAVQTHHLGGVLYFLTDGTTVRLSALELANIRYAADERDLVYARWLRDFGRRRFTL